MSAGLTFEQFLESLRELEREGELIVTKWPKDPNDDFKVQMLKDKEGRHLDVDREKRFREQRDLFQSALTKYRTEHLRRIGERGTWADGRPLARWELEDLKREYHYRMRIEQTVTWPHEAELRLYGLEGMEA